MLLTLNSYVGPIASGEVRGLIVITFDNLGDFNYNVDLRRLGTGEVISALEVMKFRIIARTQ
jgi:hypothetical protein